MRREHRKTVGLSPKAFLLDSFMIIELTQGKVAIIDDCDFDEISKYKWHFGHGRYAYTNINIEGKGMRPVSMHRMILGFPKRPSEVDHINRNGLDNRRDNLRIVSAKENQKNRKVPKNNTSGTQGVNFLKQKNRWVAYIYNNNKRIHLGCFIEKEDAILARKKAEKENGFLCE